MSETLSVSASSVVLTQRVGAFLELAKPRIAALVLAATAAGFCLAVPAGLWSAADALRLVHTLLGTALVSAGANALNQFFEADSDALMIRTRGRPLPSGRLLPREVLSFGLASGILGTLYLGLTVNPLAASLAAACLLIYVFLYTPMKRVSSLCVFVGAVSGALPPTIGWSGGTGAVELGAVWLFALVFFWQLPHFGSISWLHRADYARAGYPLIPVTDATGLRLDLHIMSHTLTLLAVSLLPTVYRSTGVIYGGAALVLGTMFLGLTLWFVCCKTPRIARVHVLASVIYLPALLGFLMLDRGLVG